MLVDIFKDAAAVIEKAIADKKPEDVRIYCDCDGTLWNRHGEFNAPLFLWLYERLLEGFEVIIFSREFNEGHIKIHSSYHTGQSDTFENNGKIVTPKSEAAGKKALLVIDDDRSSHRVDAKHHWDPNDPEVIRYINQSLKKPPRPMPRGMF